MKLANLLVKVGTVAIALLSALLVGCSSYTEESTADDPGTTTMPTPTPEPEPSPAPELEPIQADENGWEGPYTYIAEDQSGDEIGEVSAYFHSSDGRVRFEAYKGVIVEGRAFSRGDFTAIHASPDENPSFSVNCTSGYSESGPSEGRMGRCKFIFL